MTFDIGDKNSGRIQESESSARDVLTRDGDNERPGLVQKQRDQLNHLKRGGASGITGEFGKPAIVDGMREHTQSRRRHPSDLSVRQLAHPDVSVILPADRSQQESRPGDAGALIAMRENAEVKAVHKRLEHDIGRLPDAERERFGRDMEAFEKRAALADPPLSAKEVARTEKRIAELLEAQHGKVGASDRVILAEQIMHHAADPTSIDQGRHGTCSTATVEARMFARNPSAAADLITQVALNGSYTSHGDSPIRVSVSGENLKKHVSTPDKDGNLYSEESNNPPKDGDRSYASQLFQITAVNLGYESTSTKIGEVTYPPGTLEYRQRDPLKGAKPPDTGEIMIHRRTGLPLMVDTTTGHLVEKKTGRFVDMETGETVKSENVAKPEGPVVMDGTLPEIYNKITGAPESGIYLANSDYRGVHSKNVTEFKTEEELKKLLEQAQRDKKLPIIIRVDSGNEPFITDSAGTTAGGQGGPHVVSITAYDPRTGVVKMDNQWGKWSDHSLNIHDLYVATIAPDDKPKQLAAIKSLEKECADNAKRNELDYAKEAELLRLKRSHTDAEGNPLIDQEAFDRQLVWLIDQAVRDARLHHAGALDIRMQIKLQVLLRTVEEEVKADANEEVGDGHKPNRFDRMKKAIGEKVFDELMGKGNFHKLGLRRADIDYSTMQMQHASNEIHDACQWDGNDNARIFKALEGRSPAQLEKIQELFHRDHHMTIEDYLKREMSRHPAQLRKALALLHPDD